MSLFGTPNVDKLTAKRDVPGLIKALSYQKDPNVIRAAARALGNIGDTQAVPPLLALSKERDAHTRASALWALAQLAPDQAKPLLLEAFNDSAPVVRSVAITELSQPGSVDAIEPLLALLSQPDTDTDTSTSSSQEVSRALATIAGGLNQTQRQTHLIEPLGALLASPDPSLRTTALAMLDTIGWQPDQSEIAATYYVLKDQWEQCVAIGAPAAAPLIATLMDEDKNRRQTAFLTLVKIGEPVAAPLVAALNNPDTELRQAAYWCLIKIGSPAVSAIINALHDEHDDTRLASARLLGQIGDTRAVIPLIGAFRDRDWTVRREAYQAIVKIGKPALQQLIQALYHESEEIQWGAAGTLEALGWKPAPDEIGAIYWIVKGEWHRCVEIGEPAVAPLIARLDHWDYNVCKDAMGTLVRIGTPALDKLFRALKHESPNVRKHTATALGMIGDKRADPPLRELLSDKDKEVSQAASEAVSAIQTGEMWRGTS